MNSKRHERGSDKTRVCPGEYRKGYPGHFRGAIPDRHRKGVYLCHLSDSGRQRRSLVREQGYGRLVRGTTGLLLSALRNPVYSVGFSGRGVVATSNVPLYIRFLDMKKHGNYGIYNRQVWGILWNNSLQTIKYGYGKEVRDRIYAGLQEAFQRMEIRTDS
ncbi:hypothetical protein OXV71_10465 [Bacteroides fragilis]|nr:hypothetical protein [Bacteroides fragilis]